MQPALKEISFWVNGKEHHIKTDPRRLLLDVLRDDFGLTGAKYGCGEGQCGACTVLVDKKAVQSCISRISEFAGTEIITIEGLETEGRLHPLQQSFLDNDALQCGYCTPGMIMSALALLEKNQHLETQEIVQSMQGNICRCGAYPRIIRAIQQAAESSSDRT